MSEVGTKSSINFLTVGIIFGVILVAAILGFIIYFSYKKPSSDKKPPLDDSEANDENKGGDNNDPRFLTVTKQILMSANKNQVDVKFDEKFPNIPSVFITNIGSTRSPGIGESFSCYNFSLTNITTEGFTVKRVPTCSNDYYVNVTAIGFKKPNSPKLITQSNIVNYEATHNNKFIPFESAFRNIPIVFITNIGSTSGPGIGEHIGCYDLSISNITKEGFYIKRINTCNNDYRVGWAAIDVESPFVKLSSESKMYFYDAPKYRERIAFDKKYLKTPSVFVTKIGSTNGTGIGENIGCYNISVTDITKEGFTLIRGPTCSHGYFVGWTAIVSD